MIPTPIRQVLSTIHSSGLRALLMGGQACVFYGAAQISKDIDLLVLTEPTNLERLTRALDKLNATRIAVPPLDASVLERGHAVHFRCHAPGVEGVRVDVMSRLRGSPPFEALWERRVVIGDEHTEFHLLSVPDLVMAKKTQRAKDWPMIDALVSIHYHEHREDPTGDRIAFWLNEARSPELLIDLAARFPQQALQAQGGRPVLAHAISGDGHALREALDAEVRAEQEADRIYWQPLRKELEEFRRSDRRADP